MTYHITHVREILHDNQPGRIYTVYYKVQALKPVYDLWLSIVTIGNKEVVDIDLVYSCK